MGILSRGNAYKLRALTKTNAFLYAATELCFCLPLSCLPFPAAFHQFRDCPQGFIYVVCGLELASDVWCQDHNVRTGSVARSMFSAHAFAEIVLGTHLVGTARLSLILFLHIVFAHCEQLVAHL